MKRTMTMMLLCLALGTPCQARTFHVSTRAGVPVEVLHEASWDASCRSTGGPSYSLNPPPAHGSISTRPQAKTITTCAAGGCACKGRTVSGPALFYTPGGAFTGTDRFGVTATFPNGVSLNHEAVVTVR